MTAPDEQVCRIKRWTLQNLLTFTGSACVCPEPSSAPPEVPSGPEGLLGADGEPERSASPSDPVEAFRANVPALQGKEKPISKIVTEWPSPHSGCQLFWNI